MCETSFSSQGLDPNTRGESSRLCLMIERSLSQSAYDGQTKQRRVKYSDLVTKHEPLESLRQDHLTKRQPIKHRCRQTEPTAEHLFSVSILAEGVALGV